METGPYDTLSVVGEGGFATVYRAVHRKTGKPAAVKVQKDGPIAAIRFSEEIRAMQQLNHLHVMPIWEIDPKGKWYAMPLARYSLRDLHDLNPWAWNELRRALSSINGALMHTHPQGFVHRDVSPDNILLLETNHWVLSDYGIVMPRAPRGRRPTNGGTLIGTDFFSAPEVLRNPSSATPASDMYSIGAIATWFTKIKKTQSGAMSELGRYWSELIKGTFVEQPAARWGTMEVAAHLDREPVADLVFVGDETSACPRCGSRDGLDGAERCLACGFVNPY
jgi:eukaryotic-like serine/threonine-protein kinase